MGDLEDLEEETVMHTTAYYCDEDGERLPYGEDGVPMLVYDRLEMSEVLYNGLSLNAKVQDGERLHVGTVSWDPEDPTDWDFQSTEEGEQAAEREKTEEWI